MAPRELPLPGTRPTATKEATVDERSLAHTARRVRADEGSEEEQESSCFYCLSGWVFLGSIGHDGEEVIETVRCRRCKTSERS